MIIDIIKIELTVDIEADCKGNVYDTYKYCVCYYNII